MIDIAMGTFWGITKSKDQQKEAIEHLLCGRDVLAVLPTGYGKSLIFQLFVKMLARTDAGSALVICPLESIIQDQIIEAESIGITACSVSEKNVNTPQLLFAKAEDVQITAFRNRLKDKNSALHRAISLIVVDESHTVETWTGKRYVIHGNCTSNRSVTCVSSYCIINVP